MGAARFAAAHAARAAADPEAHSLAIARAENDRQIKTLETNTARKSKPCAATWPARRRR
jgi:hypothetical protein